MKFHEITASGAQIAVILGSGIDLREMYLTALTTNSSIQYWLLAGVDVEDELLPVLFSPDHPVILFRKVADTVPVFDFNLEETYEFSNKIRRLNLVQSYVEYMDSCRKDAEGNALNNSRCNDQLRHTNLQKNMVEESIDRLLESMMRGKQNYLFISNGISLTLGTKFKSQGDQTITVRVFVDLNLL